MFQILYVYIMSTSFANATFVTVYISRGSISFSIYQIAVLNKHTEYVKFGSLLTECVFMCEDLYDA